MNRFFPLITILLSLCFGLPMHSTGQTTNTPPPTTVEGWADRLTRFGAAIPQEKVFVHMDNTCYFLGDTIWYAAYTRRTDKGQPSNVSRVLYVELYNQDGYLVERQLVEMKDGHGYGNFALADTLYGGFYELRAYTRWQLNWGQTEKEHTSYAENWFFNKEMAKQFYADYDKLYSRVFPVYDKPQEPGDFFHEMTTRPLRRYFKSGAPEPQLTLSLYPEGGNVVAGVPCRIAFEAASENGEAFEGRTLPPASLLGTEQIPDEGVPTVSRGRGMFTFTPKAGQDYEFTFTATDGRTAKAKLPKAETDGVALTVERRDDEWVINAQAQGQAAQQPLGMTIMHEGLVDSFATHTGVESWNIVLKRENLESGIHQVTVFDVAGRIWADRLFFVTKPDFAKPTLIVSGIKEEYQPYEAISLQVTAPSLQGRADGKSSLSLAIRDAAQQDYLNDCGNILTEMLLSSEIKGFVPDPSYFFEADDEEHRTALDLLMMTQGWRRFDWKTMATPGVFVLNHPAETQTQVLRGEVLNYDVNDWQDDVRCIDIFCPSPYQLEERLAKMLPSDSLVDPERDFRKNLRENEEGLSVEDNYANWGWGEIYHTIVAESYAHENHFPTGSYRMSGDIARARFNTKNGPINPEVRVHAEFTQPGTESVVGDVTTRSGQFLIQAPRFEGYCVFFLGASDTTKWKSEKHTWIDMDEQAIPEYFVRLRHDYPRFTKPYNYYQTTFRPAPEGVKLNSVFNPATFETQMATVTVRARRGGLRKLDLTKPAFKEDAYTAFNEACDAGLMAGRYLGRIHYLNSVARLYVGDMNTENVYLFEPRYDGRNLSYNRSNAVIDKYNLLTNLDSISIYTDFSPRSGGDPRVTEENVARVAIDVRKLPDDGMRTIYRDRRYILQGFNVADDFYHPNYSQHPLPDGQKDYRRTLYWNPDLQLDADGHAVVSFFTGSKPTTITVEANGQANDGTLLTH